MIAGEPRRILVITVSRIGDTLLVTPAVRAIRKAYPAAQLAFLAHPKRAEILAHLPQIDRLGPITKHRARLMGWIGPKRYDLAFVYGSDRPLIEYALRAARRVVAFRQGDDAIDARLFRAVLPPAFQSMHSVPIHLALTDALGLAHDGHDLSYRVSPDETQWAIRRLAQDVPDGATPLIGVQVASFPTKGYRDWPIEHFIALGERIVAHYPRVHFLVFGGELERDRTRAFHQRFASHASHYAGELTLRQTGALMSRVDLYIGVDTGPTHIFGTMRLPMVALYHCFSPSRLIAPLEHPCLYAIDHPRIGGGPDTPMGEIAVDTVWEQVRAALEHRARASEPVSMPSVA